jgi:hypothetical protein
MKRIVWAMLLTPLAPVGWAHGDEVESRRFDNQKFYDGLIELGLLDLLDHHLAQNPPKDELTGWLLQRKIKQVIWENPAIDPPRRRAALAEANALLARLIREHPRDRRALDWQLDLARSLIYEQAEPAYTRILYHGGTAADRQTLTALMEAALETLDRLRAYLEKEYARIDELSLGEYERLDRHGYVLKIEESMPRAEYMQRWAKFYLALALEKSAPRRDRLLRAVLTELKDETSLLTIPHTTSHAQAQSLLLAGMVSRRLADDASADRYLRDAADVVRNLPDSQEKHDLQWLVLLASVERVRALRDGGRIEDALEVLAGIRRRLQRTGELDFGRRLVLAMLEASIAQVRVAGGPRRDGLGGPLTGDAVEPLLKLARAEPGYRDEVYAAIYAQVRERGVNNADLHPLQQCAVIAGLIGDATRLRHGSATSALPGSDERRAVEAEALDLLAQAADLATGLINRERDRTAREYRCEALYNLGVAEHLRGRRADAARRFVEVARKCPEYDRALAAATYAVEIAAGLAEDPSLRARDDVRDLLIASLGELVEGFPKAEAVRYWRFFYAQALEDVGRQLDAAEQYARVDRDHDQFLIARLRAGRCRTRAVLDAVAEGSTDPTEVRRDAETARAALTAFRELVESTFDSASADPALTRSALTRSALARSALIRSARAEAEVLLAELDVPAVLGQPARALATLDGFEKRFPNQAGLIGRVLRVRIVAYEATGQLAEAEQAVPRFIASAPEQAGATLQALFDVTWDEVRRLRAAERTEEANAKARSALLFAEKLVEWGRTRRDALPESDLHALRVQLAEAYVAAGDPAAALTLMDRLVAFDAQRHGDGQAHDPRILMTYARALAESQRHGEALPLYNRAFREAAPDAPHRYAALLGDLRCRVALGEDPVGIVAVIRQQRFLNPDLGGEVLKRQFAALEASIAPQDRP